MFTSVFMFTNGALAAYGCHCGACCAVPAPDPAPNPEIDAGGAPGYMYGRVNGELVNADG